MLVMEGRLNDSMDYLVSYFASLHYDDGQRLDNCSVFAATNDYYKPYRAYGQACPASAFYDPFCECMRGTRDRYSTGHLKIAPNGRNILNYLADF